MAYCKICSEYECKKHTSLLPKVREITNFSGSSPPEIFVGRWNYPNVYTGVLSPEIHGDTSLMSNAEKWHAKKLGIDDILKLRNELIYGRTTTNIKKAVIGTKFLSVMQEVALTDKSISTSVRLKKPVKKHDEKENKVPLISHAGEIKKISLNENPNIKKKIDYLVNDTEVKSTVALQELEKNGVTSSHMIKLLSAGLLGLKKNRKLVPTRWAITATDDTLSKEKLTRIRYYKSIQNIEVYNSEYLGNHYEFLLLPENYSFEVIEISLKGFGVWQDHEGFFPRKKYADSVTGAYYANRIALTKFLDGRKKQASCIVFREIRPEYYAPLGVGILREVSKEAFSNKGEAYNTLKDALTRIQKRLRLPIEHFIKRSNIIKNFGKQKKLAEFL